MTSVFNIAIIAHVDHGKTTLIDSILRQSGAFHENESVAERVMDSNDIEKERGMTISSKCTSIKWKYNDGHHRVNIIDTPGHVDFGGEVERVLCMADSVILLVDSAEGPKPQTKFVLAKALAAGMEPIVLINKIDKTDSRVEYVHNKVFELFLDLDASEKQLDFPVLYASGRDGWCVRDLAQDARESLAPLFDTIFSYVIPPQYCYESPFKMLVTLIHPDKFLGRILIGKVYQGTIHAGDTVKALNLNANIVEECRPTKLQVFEGLNRVHADIVYAGSIIAIAGMAKASVSDTIADPSVSDSIQSTQIDPSTMAVTISVNDSPLAGTEGSLLTSRVIKDRLLLEAESNIAITVKDTENKDAFIVGGRGELQLGVLIETLRREGFELSVSSPRVLFTRGDNGEILEPLEEVIIDVDEDYSNVVVKELNLRKGEMQSIDPAQEGRVSILYIIPSRALIGYHGKFLTDTRGTGIMNRLLHSYGEHRGAIDTHRNGVLISTEQGNAVAYAIFNLQARGIMFVKPGDKVYTGMIIGEHSKKNDLEVNVIKTKQLTNVRASGSDEAIKLAGSKMLTLEEMISYIQDDELVEVTPKSIRLRKAVLDSNMRKKMRRTS